MSNPTATFTPITSRNGRFMDLEVSRTYTIRGEERTSRIRIPGPEVHQFLRDLLTFVDGEWTREYQEFLVNRDHAALEARRTTVRIGTHK